MKRTSLETTRAEALQAELLKANLDKVTTQSKVTAFRAENARLSTKTKQAELRFVAERKVAVALQKKVADLEKNLVELRAGIDAEKTVAAHAYFQERSEELVSMGAELLTKGRTTGWAQYKERMLALIKAKLPDLNPALIDPYLALTEEAVADLKEAEHADPKEAERVTPDEALRAAPERGTTEETERVVPSEG